MAVWDELRPVLARLRDERPGTLLQFPDPRYEEGQPPPYQITLAPTAVAAGEDLHRRFGASVRLTVGYLPYPPGRQPERSLDHLLRLTGLGAVWVTYGCRGMYRIDARTGRVAASIRVRQAGDSLIVANGLVWVATYRGDLLRINPDTGALVGRPIWVGYGNWRIVPGAGSLWVTSFGTGSSASRIDPVTGTVTRFRNVTDVAAAGAGSLWTSAVQRVDPATGKVVASVFLPTQGAADVAFWKGQVWALTLQRTLAVVRIDPAVNRVAGTPVRLAGSIPAGSLNEPASITAGPTGLWVMDYYGYWLFHLGI